MTLNSVTLIGRLGQDPELRSTQSGTSVANFSIATNRTWNDDQGNKKEDTEWHRIVVFGGMADVCDEYLEKGRQVCIQGRISTNEWEDQDGNERSTKEIVARNVQFLSGESNGGGGGDNNTPPEESYDDDDIPF